MSYVSWHNYGYGICTDEIKEQDVGRLQTLLAYAPQVQAEVEGWLNECGVDQPAWDDYMEFDQDYCLGLATLLQKVILEAEGIELTACDDYNGRKYLIYSPQYPWEMKQVERQMTKEQLDQIYKKYICILTNIPVEVDYQAAENGG